MASTAESAVSSKLSARPESEKPSARQRRVRFSHVGDRGSIYKPPIALQRGSASEYHGPVTVSAGTTLASLEAAFAIVKSTFGDTKESFVDQLWAELDRVTKMEGYRTARLNDEGQTRWLPVARARVSAILEFSDKHRLRCDDKENARQRDIMRALGCARMCVPLEDCDTDEPDTEV